MPGMNFRVLSAEHGRIGWLSLLVWLLSAALGSSAASEGDHSLGGLLVQPRPLQDMLKDTRPSGPLYIAIPQAATYGLNTAYTSFCSPSVTLTNTSVETVDELIVGIRYFNRSRSGGAVGSTVTRFVKVRPRRDSVDFFTDALRLPSCDGLQGELEVLRCQYSTGSSCAGDVRPLGYGAIPLTLAGPKETRP